MNPCVTLTDGAGFYCWMNPDNESLLRLGSIRNKSHPLVKFNSSTKLHVTVMYSYVQPRLIFPKPKTYQAELVGFDIWNSDDSLILVGLLDSFDLEALHGHFVCLGAVHTFDPYTPHITLAEFTYDHPDIYEYCYLLNQTERPKRLSFGSQIYVDNIKD